MNQNTGGAQIIEWQDCTSYARGEVHGRDQNCWLLKHGSIRLTLVKKHIRDPENWVIHLFPGLADITPIGPSSMSIEEAKARAVQIATKLLQSAASEFIEASDAMLKAREASDE